MIIMTTSFPNWVVQTQQVWDVSDFFPNRELEPRSLHWRFRNLIGRTNLRSTWTPGTRYGHNRSMRYDCNTNYHPRNRNHNRTGDLSDLWLPSVYSPVSTDTLVGVYFGTRDFQPTQRDQTLWDTHSGVVVTTVFTTGTPGCASPFDLRHGPKILRRSTWRRETTKVRHRRGTLFGIPIPTHTTEKIQDSGRSLNNFDFIRSPGDLGLLFIFYPRVPKLVFTPVLRLSSRDSKREWA